MAREQRAARSDGHFFARAVLERRRVVLRIDAGVLRVRSLCEALLLALADRERLGVRSRACALT